MTIDEYILSQPEIIREELVSVRNTIGAILPKAEERISWGMPTWWNHHNLIHFAAQKEHIGIYPGPECITAFAEELDTRGYRHSKGAVRFPYGNVNLELIGRIAEWCGRNNA